MRESRLPKIVLVNVCPLVSTRYIAMQRKKRVKQFIESGDTAINEVARSFLSDNDIYGLNIKSFFSRVLEEEGERERKRRKKVMANFVHF
jgi:hypothetical protein